MRAKLLFVAGIGVGYILGARAGRGSYETIKSRAQGVWNDPKVQEGVHSAGEFVKDKAPVVGGKLKGAASSATSAAQDKIGSSKDDEPDASQHGAS